MNERKFRRKYGFSVLERCQYHLFKAFRDRGDTLGYFGQFNLEIQAKEMTDEILEIFKENEAEERQDLVRESMYKIITPILNQGKQPNVSQIVILTIIIQLLSILEGGLELECDMKWDLSEVNAQG